MNLNYAIFRSELIMTMNYLAQIGNDRTKDTVSIEIKCYYDYQVFDTEDVKDISIGKLKKINYLNM